MGRMKAFIKAVDRALSLWCILIVSVMTLAVIVSVVLRYLFSISFVQSEEAITMLFVGTTYFGMALGVREKDHIGISWFVEQAPAAVQKAVQALVMAIIIGVSAVMLQQSLLWIRKVGGIPSPAMQVPYRYFYAMVPASSVLMIFYAAVNVLDVFVPVPPADRGYAADEELAAGPPPAPGPDGSLPDAGVTPKGKPAL
jgi:TRAP-type transport system small permease protein